jgi:thioredoxin-like negative regulator of GroEL
MVAAAAPVASFLSAGPEMAITAWAMRHVFAASQGSAAASLRATISFG